MNILAIIPARGGSKGLPGKNIKPLNGKPLVAYSIEAANKSKFINKLVLSTDSNEISQVCSHYDIEIPFMRPAELATDDADATDAYRYTIDRLQKETGYNPDIVVILQPTSPLRTAQDIDNAIEIFLKNNANAVIGVCETDVHPNRIKIIQDDGTIRPRSNRKGVFGNRQDNDKVYLHNGNMFVFKPSVLFDESGEYPDKTYPYIMPVEHSTDIDTQHDFDITEFLMRKRG